MEPKSFVPVTNLSRTKSSLNSPKSQVSASFLNLAMYELIHCLTLALFTVIKHKPFVGSGTGM